MKVHFEFSHLAETDWHEGVIRSVLGGAATLLAGLLAKYFGPVFGGLFLALPAIFPASASLVQKHEEERKRSAGITHTVRGVQAAALDARGAAMGSIGLACFGLIVWKLLPGHNALATLLAAMAAWLAVSMSIWRMHKLRHVIRARRRGAHRVA
jgi:hypothetical protein